MDSSMSEGPKLYVVCDHADAGAVWQRLLSQEGLEVVVEASLERAVETWYADTPDLSIVDVRSSRGERLEVCRSLRNVSVAPMLVILPEGNEREILEVYQAGADDCIVGPVSPAVFQARVLAWARRSWTIPLESVRGIWTKSWELDPQKHALVRADGKSIALTNFELRLLYVLMSEPGRIFTADELVHSSRRVPMPSGETSFKKVMERLRKKINAGGRNGKPLQTWKGGYAFVDK